MNWRELENYEIEGSSGKLYLILKYLSNGA